MNIIRNLEVGRRGSTGGMCVRNVKVCKLKLCKSSKGGWNKYCKSNYACQWKVIPCVYLTHLCTNIYFKLLNCAGVRRHAFHLFQTILMGEQLHWCNALKECSPHWAIQTFSPVMAHACLLIINHSNTYFIPFHISKSEFYIIHHNEYKWDACMVTCGTGMHSFVGNMEQPCKVSNNKIFMGLNKKPINSGAIILTLTW